MSDAPKTIYLQWHGDGDPEFDNGAPEYADVTWAAERVFDGDVTYVREAEITRLRELVAGQDDGGHWYSQASMDAVVRERDKYREVLEVVAKGAYTLSIMQSKARDALGDA